jgi:drug/metabolite transporter (DMT)-like permease
MELNLVRSKSFLTPLLLIAPFFLWGTAMVAMKGVMPNTTPLFLASIRILPAGVLVLVAAAILGKSQPQGWRAWLWILLFALVDGTMFQGFLAEGLTRTSAGLGSVAIDSQPLIVAVLSWWFYQERIGWRGWLGLALGMLGIAAIGLPEAWLGAWLGGEPQTVEIGQLLEGGLWLMLLASVSMAVGTVMMPKVSQYVDPVVATGWHMILGGLPLVGMSAAWESQQWANVDGWGWCSIAYATVFGSALSYGLFFFFASKGNLTSLSALTFMTPVFALLFGNLFLAEVLTPLQWAGVSIALLGIWSIERVARPDLEEQV